MARREEVVAARAAAGLGQVSYSFGSTIDASAVGDEVPRAFLDDAMAFGCEPGSQILDAAGILGVQFAAGFERAPVGRNALAAGLFVFVGRVGGDPGEDAGGDRAGDRRAVLRRRARGGWRRSSSACRGGLSSSAASTSSGAGITNVPCPTRFGLSWQSIFATLGKSLLSAAFLRQRISLRFGYCVIACVLDR